MRLTTLHCILSLKGGGAEKQFGFLLRGLRKAGANVHAVILQKGVNYDLLASGDVTIHLIKSRSVYNPLIIFKLIKIIRKTNPDIIELWLLPFVIFGGIAARLMRRSFVMVERSDPNVYCKGLSGILLRLTNRMASGIIANSVEGRSYWQTVLNKKINFRKIENILDFESLAKTANGNYDDDYIIYVGRLTQSKNVAYLLKAFSNVSNLIPGVKLYIVGEGPLKDSLLTESEELGIAGKVKFLGYVNPPYYLMKKAKAFVSISLQEGMPNTVLEAAALKIPLLLSDITPHLDLFSGSAIFVNAEKIDDTAEAIRYILDPENKNHIFDLTENAFRKVETFSEENIVNQYLTFYQEVLT